VGQPAQPNSSDRLPDADCISANASSTLSAAPFKSHIFRHPPVLAGDDLPPSDSAELVSCVAQALVLAIEAPRQLVSPASPQASPGIFDSSVVPNISVERYLKRLKTVFECSDAVLVLALIIVDRLLERDDVEPHRITTVNVHRLYLASLIVTVKYNEDLVYGNSHYARAGGIQLREVNRLERFFLRALDYDFRVLPDQYHHYERSLLQLRSQLATSRSVEAPGFASGPSQQPVAKKSSGSRRDAETGCAKVAATVGVLAEALHA